MGILGLRDTSGFVADQRPKDFYEGIQLSYPNGKLMLTGLTSLLPKRKVTDPEFYWWEKRSSTRRTALTASITTTTAVLTVSASGVNAPANEFKVGDILRSEQTGEQFRVNADPPSTTAIPVERGWAGTTATAITYNGAGVNPNVVCIGSVFEEGSNAPTGVSRDPVKKYNLCGIARQTFEATKTAMQTRLRTKDDVLESKRECLELIGMDLELQRWFGVRYEGTKNGKPIREPNGIHTIITTDNPNGVFTADTSTGVTMDQFEEWMKAFFAHGSNEKMGICGNEAALTIQQIIRKNSSYQIFSGEKEFGMNVMRLTCPFGDLVIKTHPLFNQQTSGTTGGSAYYALDSYLYVLDMAEFKHVYLDGRDLQFQRDLQANDLDGMKAGFIAETSLEMKNAHHHFLVKNLALAASA